MKKRLLSMALILCLVVTLFPAAALAATEILVDGTTYTYDTAGLQAAIDAAADGDTVKLEGDIDLGTTGITVTGKSIILDLNGQTITYSGTVTAVTPTGAANLTVQDSSTGGKITSASAKYILKNAGSGTLTLAGGTIEGTSTDPVNTFGIVNNGTGRLNITGGTVQTTNMFALLIDTNSGDVTISGGTLKATEYGLINHIGNTAKLTISGNALIECTGRAGDGGCFSIHKQTAILEIQGGRIIGDAPISCWGSVEISGGYIQPKISTYHNTTIAGGFLERGTFIYDSGTCSVNGGYVTATDNNLYDYNLKNAAGDSLKNYSVLLRDADNNTIKNTAVTNLSTDLPLGYTYGLNDVKTNANGYLCVWLPAGKTGVSVTAGGSTYSGAVTLESRYYQGTLRLPSQNPAADTTSVAKTTAAQASVDFPLTTAPTGTWKVYASAAATDAITGVTAALSGTTLTLTASDGDIETMPYYVTVTEPNKNESARLALTVQAPVVNAAAPVIKNDLSTTQVEYNQNAAAAALDATATVTDGGTLSYEWYSNTTNSTVGATPLGVTTPTYIPSTATAGTTYYYCVVTNTNNAATETKIAQTTSAIANIKVNALVDAVAPVITNNLSNTQVEYNQNAAATALDATATVSDGGTISYAWYSNTTNSTAGATAIAGADTASYMPSTAAAGTTYYYCVVTNTNNAVSGTKTAQTTSAIANIKVNAASSGGSRGGSGHSSTVSDKPVITVSEVKSELFSNAEDIKVEADVNSAFGESVTVKLTDDVDSQKEVFSLAGAKDKVYPFDISLYSKTSNEKVQPKDGYSVKITLPVPKELLDDREKIKVVYGKDGRLETLKSELTQKDGKWYITFEATHFSPYALIVNAEPAKTWANPFSDVKASDWYYSAVQYAAQNGLMKGTGSNTFSPGVVTNRGMIATILYNLDGSGDAEQSTFKDVKPGAYYANAVAWAQQKGIIAGYGNGIFGPDDSITREQLAAMLWKYAGSPAAADSKGLASFKDAGEISAYAQNALDWANQEGIINGKGGGLLDPKGKATRAEAAQIMQNFLQKAD